MLVTLIGKNTLYKLKLPNEHDGNYWIKNDNETFRLIVDTSTRGFKMWAMRNINCVEVVKPNSLRQEMKEIIKEAEKRYE